MHISLYFNMIQVFISKAPLAGCPKNRYTVLVYMLVLIYGAPLCRKKQKSYQL